jgi:DNA modification methylase
MTSNQAIPWLPTKRTCTCKSSAQNCLSSRSWLRNQVPIWQFNKHELGTTFDLASRKHHPAIFPTVLSKRVIRNYTHENETVLDIFCGVGTTLYTAQVCKRNAIGIELNQHFFDFTKQRLRLNNDIISSTPAQAHRKTKPGQNLHIINDDANNILKYIPKNTIDLFFTSPPYWDMLKQQPSNRNLKNKKFLKENYSDDPLDLSNNQTLDEFKTNIKDIFSKVYLVLKPGARCVVNTGDFRRAGEFISLSNIYIQTLQDIGFNLKNTIIWDRRNEYDIGLFSYPNDFIVNNGMFEYLLEFKKD